nr:MAG TPA: hypothetical protein [Caudoviricetes sp.]
MSHLGPKWTSSPQGKRSSKRLIINKLRDFERLRPTPRRYAECKPLKIMILRQ